MFATPEQRSADVWMRAALCAYLLFVVYGSLVPLDYSSLPFDEAWRRFRSMPFLQLGVESRADWIANGVLYAPVGFLTARQLLLRNWWLVCAGFVATAFGVALALGVEFAQVFFPARTVSLNDVVAECIGSLFGATVALIYPRRRNHQPAPLHLALPWVKNRALYVYSAAYLAFCLFPYDLLISRAEFEQKLASDLWGWWLAGRDHRFILVVLQLCIETALTAPLGVLLGQRAVVGSTVSYGRAAWVGLVVGLVVEGTQLLIASGTTQGLSVLTRILGMVMGLAAWRRRESWNEDGLRTGLARLSRGWLPAYLVLLAAINGWFTWEWQGTDAMSSRLEAVRFLPFYYHYYTTEARALSSLASVMLMYLPMGALAWAWRRSAWTAAGYGAAACFVIEASKLSLAGLHPDPTNLLVAASACWAGVRAADAWSSRSRTAALETTVAARPGRSAHAADSPPQQSVGNLVLLGVMLLVVGGSLVSTPVFVAMLVVVLVASAIAVGVRPRAAMLIIPALLPVLDLAPWSGRFFWDAFDLLLMICLTIGYARAPKPHPFAGSVLWFAAVALLALSLTLSTVIGAMPWPWVDANSFSSYYSPYNALRIVKGAVWACLFVGLFQRLQHHGRSPSTSFASGMALGLAYVVAFVVWERLAFVGLFDFSDVYRVTGPFSAMHRGGAFIECYIAVATPFVVLCVLEARRWPLRLAGAALLVGATYAMMVTFSRNGYAALGASLLFLLLIKRGSVSWRKTAVGALLVAAMLAAALPVLLGSFAQERLSNWTRDLSVRQAHWNDALAMRDGEWASVFGMGLGRFPATHYWSTREPVRAASYRLEADGDTPYLRLGGGGGLYMDQIVPGSAAQPLNLTLRFRANQPGVVLTVSLCEKWMLTSRRCVSAPVRSSDTATQWTDIETTIDATPLAEGRGLWARPLKLALHSPADGTVVDVTQVGLLAPNGDQMLSNGDFRDGLDRWFFSTDIDPPWHIHNLAVAILFEQGWFGIVAWTLLLVIAIHWAARRAWQGERHAAAMLAALVAFLISGSLNTLIDEPRFLFLLLVFAALCCASRQAEPESVKSATR